MEKELLQEVDNWWASLTVADKEKITTKAWEKGKDESAKDMNEYPRCTQWWNQASDKIKLFIYKHSQKKHGLIQDAWQEGDSMSY